MSKLPYDLNKTGRVTAFLLLVYCAAELVFAWTSFRLFTFYDLVESGNLTAAELDQAAASVDAQGIAVAVFFIGTLIACLIAASMWIYRAAANAQDVVPDADRITPGWSVGWFAVPFASLWMPYKAIRQHWNGLHGHVTMDAPLPGWATLWWVCWLLGNTISIVSSRIAADASTIDNFRTSSSLDIVSSGVSIIAALLFRRLVLEMTHASAEASPHTVPSPGSDPQSSE